MNVRIRQIQISLILIMIGILGIAYVLATSPNFGDARLTGKSPLGGDFLQEWIGAHVVATYPDEKLFDEAFLKEVQHDETLLKFSWAEQKYFSMVYPPFYYKVLAPIASLEYATFVWVMAISMIACLMVSIFLVAQSVYKTDQSARPSIGIYLVPAAICFALTPFFLPVVRSFTTGQKGPLCLLIFAATFAATKSNRHLLAGMIFGCLCFKPQLAIVLLLVMMFAKNWRFVVGFFATCFVCGIVTLSMGMEVCQSYLQFCTGVGDYVQTGGYAGYKSHCLYGFLNLIAGESNWMTKLGWLAGVVFIAKLLLDLFSGSKLKINNLQDKSPPNRSALNSTKPENGLLNRVSDLRFAAIVIATILLSPHLFTYDLTLMLLPLMLIAFSASDPNSGLELPNRIRLQFLALTFFVVCGFSYYVAALANIQISTMILLLMVWEIRQAIRASALTGRSSDTQSGKSSELDWQHFGLQKLLD